MNMIYALLIAITLVGVQTIRLKLVKDEYASFQVSTKALADVAAAQAKQKEAENKSIKDKADAKNAKLRADNSSLAKRLRDERAGSNFVPAAPADSTSPDRATFDRTELERAIQGLDGEVSTIVGKGDQAVIDLNTAKGWSHEIGTE